MFCPRMRFLITQMTLRITFSSFSSLLNDSSSAASLPSGTWCVGLTAPIGKGGAKHTRMYTPVACSASTVELMIKVYDEGVMSKHVHSLSPGDTLDFVGPKQKLDYKPNMVKQLALLAGGTGITPMLQVRNAALTLTRAM